MPCEADVSSKSRSTLFFSQAGAGMNTGAPSKAAGFTDLERRSSHASHDSIWRAMRLRIRMLNLPSQPCNTAANSGQLRRIGLYATRHQQRTERSLDGLTKSADHRVGVRLSDPEGHRELGSVQPLAVSQLQDGLVAIRQPACRFGNEIGQLHAMGQRSPGPHRARRRRASRQTAARGEAGEVSCGLRCGRWSRATGAACRALGGHSGWSTRCRTRPGRSPPPNRGRGASRCRSRGACRRSGRRFRRTRDGRHRLRRGPSRRHCCRALCHPSFSARRSWRVTPDRLCGVSCQRNCWESLWRDISTMGGARPRPW